MSPAAGTKKTAARKKTARSAGARRSAPGEIRHRRAGIVIAASLLLLSLLWLLRAQVLTGIGDFLTVQDELQPAEFIYLLSGDPHTRPYEAARLYHEGLAPLIVFPMEEERPATAAGLYPQMAEVYATVLRDEGVPPSAIRRLVHGDGVTSTADEGAALLAYLQANPARRVIVVTSDYHTRRARWNLRRQLGGYPVDLLIAGAPDDRFSESDWWKSEDGMLAYFQEYLKWVHNVLVR